MSEYETETRAEELSREVARLNDRITELQAANTREVERRRVAESKLSEATAERRIDGKFHVSGSRIYKTSSGEVIPIDEPLLLFRGRDYLALPTIQHYRKLCEIDGCNDFQLGLVDKLIATFAEYAAEPSRMKQPGVTRGAPWKGHV